MRIIYILSFLFLLPHFNVAQSADFIILKKKNKTVKMFYEGSNIEFVTNTGAYRNAVITKIKNDSIFLKEYLISRIPTTLGFYVVDTIGSYHFDYSYKQIAYFGKVNKKFNVGGSGAALMGGGTLLTLASGVVYIADRKNFSPALMLSAIGLAGLGYLMNKSARKGITVGKNHYRLQYMNTNVSQK